MHSQHATCIARSMMLEGTTSAAVGVSPQHQGFFFSSACCSVLALGVDLGTGFGSGFGLRPAANMTCLALASNSM
jgi:hypothetical protein